MNTIEWVWLIYITFPGGSPIPVNSDHPFDTEAECRSMLHDPQVVGLVSTAVGASISCGKVRK